MSVSSDNFYSSTSQESSNGGQEALALYRTILSRPGFVDWNQIVEKAKQERWANIIFNNGKLYSRYGWQMASLPESFQPDASSYEKALISTLPSERHLMELMGASGATDFGVTIEGMRMRGNVYRELQGLSGVFRPISANVLSDAELMLDSKIIQLVTTTKQGFVLVTGPTGSGKSATVVALLEKINEVCSYNVITIEDPIEYVFTPKRSIFSQREVGDHVESFDSALRSAMRENPDVIFVGEIRDYPTLSTALKAAETGHLVFATLHTRRVYTTLNRLLQLAPPGERDAIRDALAQNILMILCQNLLQRRGGGLVPCREIAIRNNAVISCISSGKVRDINNVMISNRPFGMIDWNAALNLHMQSRLITEQEANLYRDREVEV
ncbi:MAG: type IV pilus twitching motility protein PilT [Verrucomicrobiota bacterium]